MCKQPERKLAQAICNMNLYGSKHGIHEHVCLLVPIQTMKGYHIFGMQLN